MPRTCSIKLFSAFWNFPHRGLNRLRPGSRLRSEMTASSGETVSAFVDQKKAEVSAASGDNLKWVKFDGGYRIQSPNGKYRKGFVKYKNKVYYFDSKGYLKTGFFKADGKVYYASLKKGYKGKGEILTGLCKIGKYYYYLDPSSKPHAGALKKGFQKIKRNLYYFNSKGDRRLADRQKKISLR